MPLHKFNNPGLAYYKALSKYLELVREIPEVVEVRLSGDDELYAIISATPFDADPCYRVCWAEGKVMDSVNPQPYRFRSVNAQELPSEGRDEHITHLGSPVWAREAMSEPTEHKEGIVTTSKLNNTGLVYYQAMSKYLELVQEIPEVGEVRLSGNDTLYTSHLSSLASAWPAMETGTGTLWALALVSLPATGSCGSLVSPSTTCPSATANVPEMDAVATPVKIENTGSASRDAAPDTYRPPSKAACRHAPVSPWRSSMSSRPSPSKSPTPHKR